MNELNSAPLKPQLRMYVPMSGSYYGEEPISVTICLGKNVTRAQGNCQIGGQKVRLQKMIALLK